MTVYEVDLAKVERDVLAAMTGTKQGVNTMKLDRNTTHSGIGKYGLVLIRKLNPDDLEALINPRHPVVHHIPRGAVDLGLPSDSGKGGFFVLRYQDKFAEVALRAYATAVYDEYDRTGNAELLELYKDVMVEADKARDHKSKKIPD
jgi:hypothetical protein